MCRVFCQKWKSLSRVLLFATPWTVVYGILQARILKWVAFPFSRGSFQPRDQTQVSCIAGGFFTNWATREENSMIQWKKPWNPRALFLMIPFCLLSFHSFSCEKLIWVWARIYLSSLLFLRSYNSYISMIIQRLFAWHTLWTNFHIFENRQLWNGTWNLSESSIKPFSPFMGFSIK